MHASMFFYLYAALSVFLRDRHIQTGRFFVSIGYRPPIRRIGGSRWFSTSAFADERAYGERG